MNSQPAIDPTEEERREIEVQMTRWRLEPERRLKAASAHVLTLYCHLDGNRDSLTANGYFNAYVALFNRAESLLAEKPLTTDTPIFEEVKERYVTPCVSSVPPEHWGEM